jgi:hypothetical protein
MIEASAPSEIAYYYPEPYWHAKEGSWIKSLLLFFDEIAYCSLTTYSASRGSLIQRSLAR